MDVTGPYRLFLALGINTARTVYRTLVTPSKECFLLHLQEASYCNLLQHTRQTCRRRSRCPGLLLHARDGNANNTCIAWLPVPDRMQLRQTQIALTMSRMPVPFLHYFRVSPPLHLRAFCCDHIFAIICCRASNGRTITVHGTDRRVYAPWA